MLNRKQLTRRTMLRGLGVSLALPWLETFTPDLAIANELLKSGRPADGAPRRMAFIFVPNGVNLDHWTPRQEGFGYELPSILQPLAPLRDEILLLSGLTHDKGRSNGDGPGDHARSASVFLTGSQPRKTSGADIRSGISVDQAAAQVVGKQTRFASLELGCEPGRGAGNCDSGYSCAYSSNISWASGASPMGKETKPREVFERLFSDSSNKSGASRDRRLAMKKSVLDFIADDARSLQKQLGGTDNKKLDEYLTGVREIEQRLERAEREPHEDRPEYSGPSGTPREYADHIRLMCDMMVLAFQTDSTRIATFMFANAGSNRNYRMIDVPDGHHQLSHHGGDPNKLEKIRKINHFHAEGLAYLLEKMKSVREGEGTLLDNSMVVYGSGLSDGNRHNNENLPVLLAGRGGGTINPGRHVRFNEETPMCNLFMSMLDRMGAPRPYIGDSTGRLSGLTL